MLQLEIEQMKASLNLLEGAYFTMLYHLSYRAAAAVSAIEPNELQLKLLNGRKVVLELKDKRV